MALPLAGIRVLDMATMLAGPLGAAMLGDMGADVIKIEPPYGDEARAIGPRVGDDSGFFVGVNRNKRGIVVDLTRPEGREVYFRLVRTADVVVENLRPNAKARLGVDYGETSRQNARIIYISVSAFGPSGPYAGRPGIDPLAQALSGFMNITGERAGGPLKAGPAIADATCGNLVAFAAMVGLWARERYGQGQQIDLSLIDSMIHLQPVQVGQFFLTNYIQPRVGSASPFFAPYGTFTCRDGRSIMVAALNDKFFRNLCRAIENEALADDPRFRTTQDRLENEDALNALVQAYFSRRDIHEMMGRLVEADMLAAPVYAYDETFSDPQVVHNRMAVEVEHGRVGKLRVGGVPVKLARTPGGVRLAPPTMGQHTGEVLRELGYSEVEVDRLRARGAVR